jgi:hypothetical protein
LLLIRVTNYTVIKRGCKSALAGYNLAMLEGLNHVEFGGGFVRVEGSHAELCLAQATSDHYADAQLDDTHGLSRRRYHWRPPLQFSLRARFSHDAAGLRGTAGFGFWNVPFGPGDARVPALPQAIWFFFGSQPHNLPLALDVAGSGWKASCLDASRKAALLWAPLAPLALLAMQSASVYRWLWPRIQRALGVSEAEVQVDMDRWHSYCIDWEPNGATFAVDEQPILRAPISPRGPLGFVTWIDNQYAIATPRGRFGWGLLDIEQGQCLEIADLGINQA